MISSNDLGELRRIATNTYDNDKKFVNRIILEFSKMEREINALRTEIASLKLRQK